MAKKPGKDAKNPLDIEIGRRIRMARISKKWSQEELAAATGWKPDEPVPTDAIHPSSVAMYERGERRPPLEQAMTLERIFGPPAAYWLALIDEYEADILQAIQKRPQRSASGR